MIKLNEVCDNCGIEADCCDYSEKNGHIWQCECCYSNICTKCLEALYGESISEIVDGQVLCGYCKNVLE